MASISDVKTATLFCPAKINLFLAVTGCRDDGFHDLVSLVSQISWGDELEVGTLPDEGRRLIECNDPDVPTDSANLVWRAADVFAVRTGLLTGFRFRLMKRVPTGAGLGGGSSDAVGALKGMNRLSGRPLSSEDLLELAGVLGSDCPLFLHDGPVVLRGRGERVEALSSPDRHAWRGLRLALFKPPFGVDTAWAYGELSRRGQDTCLAPDEAEERLQRILLTPDRLADWHTNSFDAVVGRKFPAIPVMLERLRGWGGGAAFMTGSGSACVFVVRSDVELGRLRREVRDNWGDGGFLADVRLL